MARFRQMQPQEKAIYVALGNDRDEGFKTLRWTLIKWKFQPISIIILHIDITKETVMTYFGKMPASSVNEEMLEVLRKNEQGQIDKLLSQYKAFCGKVKAEIFKVDKYEKPIPEHIIDLISGLHITNLVMGLTFMKSSSRKSKSAISGCFYIHQNKPEFCEFFIISGGKQILMQEDKFVDSNLGSPSPSSSNPDSPNVENQWENCAEEMENYLHHLLSLNLDEEQEVCEQENDSHYSPMEAEMKELQNSNMSVAEKSELLRRRIKETNERTKSKRNEDTERLAKAEFAISLCNRREEGVEALIAREVTNRAELKKELDATRELLREALADVEESMKRLNSLADPRSDLSEELQRSAAARSEAEERLKAATIGRAKTAAEMEKLRRQRDVFRRRIEFCRERDAIGNGNGMAERVSEWRCELREFSGEIKSATNNFSEHLRFKSGGDWTAVYKGRINLQTVAIKVINASLPEEEFQFKVKFLGEIRHPNLIAMIGFCSEPQCIVFEYMHNGSLRDILVSSYRNSAKRNPALPWHDRIRIAAQVCSGLCYLHQAQPKPIVHGRLTASNILLDRNLVARISGFGLSQYNNEAHIGSDVEAFGLLLMHLLTGSNWVGLVDEAMLMDKAAFVQVLDETAGEWPLEVVEGLAILASRCLTLTKSGHPNRNLRVEMLMEELEELSKKADELVDRRRFEEISDEGEPRQDPGEVPSVFLCPIFQEVMKNPHVAADGFSYEQEAIEEWLKMGRDTSPMTNLKLKDKFLTPNHTLHSLIQDWHHKRSIVPP
ncbi:Putative U-box domain-containing protein 50 [Morus notabilis]|uniref:RING-type E3 ubiquitin transferase n=1 Tax=Morus notabilis TaxID=981085 RepID=W9SD09_9ROSA|nr:Putative U-box domain-containing protein 50 [Morus notabilis]